MNTIIGIFVILIGCFLLAIGIANTGETPLFVLPGADLLVGLIPSFVTQLPVIGSFGALLPLGLPGLIIGVYGLRMMMDKGVSDEDEDEDEDEVVTAEGGIAIGELVNMSQGTMSDEQMNRVIDNIRPNLKQYVSQMDAGAVQAMARAIVQYEIMHFQRDSKKNVSADQYAAQAKRMTEVENKAFAKRYMPHGTDMPDVAKQSIGKIFDLSTQAKLEQEFHSEVKDWADVSLDNIANVMAQSPGAQA